MGYVANDILEREACDSEFQLDAKKRHYKIYAGLLHANDLNRVEARARSRKKYAGRLALYKTAVFR